MLSYQYDLLALDQFLDVDMFVNCTVVHDNHRVRLRKWVHVFKKTFDESFECHCTK